MTQRTINEAREALDNMALPPATRREYEKHLGRHVRTELARLSVSQAEQHGALDQGVTDIKQAFSEIQQELEDLEQRSRTSDFAARDYAHYYGELQQRRNRTEHRAMSLQSQLDAYCAIEEDPEGYIDSLYERFPAIRHDFPW